MKKIAIGCDHRGSEAATAVVTDVLYSEKSLDVPGDFFRKIVEQESLATKGVLASTRWVGALEIVYEQMDDGKFRGVSLAMLDVPIVPLPLLSSSQASSEYGNTQRIDYPDVAAIVAQKVSKGEVDYGVLICGTGIGMCIVANKFPGVRAAACHNESATELSRCHNNANVLCISGEMLGPTVAGILVKRFLTTPYEGGRHDARLQKIAMIEKETGL